jgi:dTDP-4-amino-4,6-dideoxygalactose transaminase
LATSVVKDQPAAAAAPSACQPLFPFLDLKAQFSSIKEDVVEAVTNVLISQQFILGPEVKSFENEIAEFLGCRFAIGCASGSDALLLSLMAIGIQPGDEVITTPFTFVATAGSIARLGAKPVFADIDPQTCNLDPAQIEKAISQKTRAIIPVHLFGQSAEMSAIMKVAEAHGVAVIEDAAQAIGALYHGKPVGTLGTLGCFSFFPSKNLGGAGDGGLITTNDATLADRLKLLRVHGSRSKYEYEVLGINSRLDSLQAAILRVKLRRLHSWTNGRRRNAETYRNLFSRAGVSQIKVPVELDGLFHVYNQFVIRVQDRKRLREHLRQTGVPTEIYYPSSLHLQPAFKYLGYKTSDFPEAESASAEVLALPIFSELTVDQLQTVVDAIAKFYDDAHGSF